LTPDFISSNNTQKVRYAGYQPKYITVNANTSVSNTTGRITKSSHGFANGEYVVYQVSGGNTAIGGLVDGTGYYVAQANTTTFKLSTTRAGTSTISLTSGVTETGHTFLSLYSSSNNSSINLNGNNSGAALQFGSPRALSTGDTAYGGFGFVKFPGSHMDSILLDCLRFDATTIGSIAAISGINPGTDYNVDPFVVVHDPYVAGYDKHDYVMHIDTPTGAFIRGEQIQQAYDQPAIQLTVNNFSCILDSNRYHEASCLSQGSLLSKRRMIFIVSDCEFDLVIGDSFSTYNTSPEPTTRSGGYANNKLAVAPDT